MQNRYLHYYKPYKWILIGVMVGSCLAAVLDLLFPYIVRHLLNVEIPEKNISEMLKWAGVLLGLYIFNFALLFAINYYGHIMSVGIENDMRRDLFGHMEKCPSAFLTMPAQGSCCRVLRVIL